ncbi:ABC transporter permease [Miniphocaeibacter massiliensis]|uniref:ABC transporter permease n=1 Tax=Miniphocaeibacter massiliensis TaxID=2041841 RepID=UPI000C070279|nr:FtsX-like permease family protein [Miniphocaeibacter massiliensis]
MKLIRKIAYSNNKSNKTRSILVILSIILTTILLTSIGTFMYAAIKNQADTADKLYGSYYGIFKRVTDNEITEMERKNAYTDIGKTAFAGSVDSNSSISLVYNDKTTNKLTNIEDKLKEGSFPNKNNEITGSKELFKELGFSDVKIGDTITLNSRFDNNSKFEEKEFVISGLLNNENIEIRDKSYVAYVSEEFYENESQGNNIYSAYFRINENIEINGNNQEEVIKDLGKDLSLEENQVDVNNFYLMFTLQPKTDLIVGVIVVALLVIIFSIIVIYNIFQIGILQKVQEYGKIKALGATKKQLKKIVVKEGMSLAFIAIPIGLLLGVFVGTNILNFIMDESSKNPLAMVANSKINYVSVYMLLILVVVSILVLITVRISLIKPTRIVSKIFPIEAIRYQGTRKVTKIKRKGKKTLRLKNIIFSNFSANKTRTIKTIFTMGLSCVLFVVIANIAGNFDAEFEAKKDVMYGKFYISLDYSFNDTAYPENNLDNILKNNPISKELINEIKNIPNVKEIKTRNIMTTREISDSKKSEYTDIMVIDDEDFYILKNENEEKYLGNTNYKDIVEKDGLLYSSAYYLKQDGYKLNQDIKLDINSKNTNKELSSTIEGAFPRFLPTTWAITEETFQDLGLEENIGFVWVDCEDKYEDEVLKELENIIGNNKQISMMTYSDSLTQAESIMYITKIASYAFLVIIGLIGFMNMANTIIISIITRKQEFGVLQAVGMTNKQLNRMLQTEGLIFTIGTIAISLLLGLPLGYFAFYYLKDKVGLMGLNIYHIPYKEIIIMILAIALLQGILSFVLLRNVKKESLVDRIRFSE